MAGVVLEGLQDLLVQYLQLKLDFGVADVVRQGAIVCGAASMTDTCYLHACYCS